MARGRGGSSSSGSSSGGGSSSGSDGISQEGYNIAQTVIFALWIIPLTVLFFISLCLARRKSDPARVGVAWIKTVFPFWILNLVLGTASSAVIVVYLNLDSSAPGLLRFINHTSITGTFLEHLADLFLFITFVELSSGFLLCLNGGQSTPARKPARYAILAWTFVLFVLSLSQFGLLHAMYARGSSGLDYDEYLRFAQDLLTSNRLGGAIHILKWITSIPMVAFASYVVHKTNLNSQLRSSAILLLVATILDFIRLLIVMAIFCDSVLSQVETVSLTGTSTSPAVLFIVAPLFDTTLMFILLVLLFTLAVRKSKGLWSMQAQQPGTYFPAVVYVPNQGGQAPVAYGGVAAQPPQPQFQQQPQMQQQPPQNLPAYLQVAQQQQWQQAQQQQQQQQTQQQHQYPQQQYPQQGYYYYPQQPQPQPQQQQQQQQSQPVADPKSEQQDAPPVANGFQAQGQGNA